MWFVIFIHEGFLPLMEEIHNIEIEQNTLRDLQKIHVVDHLSLVDW